MSCYYFISVDVGTSSVRAAVVRDDGCVLAKETASIKIWSGFKTDHFEQSSSDIWDAVILSVTNVMKTCGLGANSIHGVGFDATCSLVAVDANCKPIPVGYSGNEECNIIMWMDHRAKGQAERINSTRSPLLDSVGGKISVEMELPKLLWIKENLKEDCWDKADYFFELPDFLTWKATGCLSRSLCSVVSKWLYDNDPRGLAGWPVKFLTQIGLEDLCDKGFQKIGSVIQSPGEACGEGLCEEVATALGLNPGTPVATSVIDAHAGCLGAIACKGSDFDETLALPQRLTMICGTSTCHLAVSEHTTFVGGVWGPFYSILLPGLWLSEAGQSSAGSLIDHIVTAHPAYSAMKEQADRSGQDIYEHLNQVLETLRDASHLSSVSPLTRDLHIWPDYHGNRSPLADDSLTGMWCGLTLACGVTNLAKLYLSTVQALAYGTRHILDKMSVKGQQFKVIAMCGGLSKNRLYVKMHADATGLTVVVPHTTDTVLLGSAMLAAKASGLVSSLQEAMDKMSGCGDTYKSDLADKSFHDKKYRVFLKMLADQQDYHDIMTSG